MTEESAPTLVMNSLDLSTDEDEPTAMILWATSCVSRSAGSLSRSFAKASAMPPYRGTSNRGKLNRMAKIRR